MKILENPTICSCCLRECLKMTKHHLIPRTRHKNKKTRKDFNHADLHATIDLCSPCHRQIHAVFSEKELERHYHTIEVIRSNPEIIKFFTWIKNKPPDFQTSTKKRR